MHLVAYLARHQRTPQRPGSHQNGVVLVVALIILVAMTLAGVALIRSVDTGNIIAGNLAFHQSATSAGERSTEHAITNWLMPNSDKANTALHADNKENGYSALRVEPEGNDSWDTFWTKSLQDMSVIAAPGDNTCPSDASADVACNRVRYVIHRLCAKSGPPNTTANPCTQPPPGENDDCHDPSKPCSTPVKKVYYRVTTRVQGPRNTVSYIQTIVSL